MIELQGKYTSAKVFTNTLDSTCQSQIIELLNSDAFENSKIRIMPDVHAGKGSVIGFTASLQDKVIPNVVGVDIGCGMFTVELGNVEINYEEIDQLIREKIPFGFNVHENQTTTLDFPNLKNEIHRISALTQTDAQRHINSLGTLGGGNHFIEIAEDSKGSKFLVVHSGSRNFGLQIATYHQKIAMANHTEGNKDLAYLEGDQALQYLRDMRVGIEFAVQNRVLIADEIVFSLGLGPKITNFYHTIHNYINEGMIRKGAISAREGKLVTIPINMRDGSIIGRGKGNEDWNYSAPHGAGRLMGRNQAKRTLSMEEFTKTMSGVYTTSVKESTLDEAPDAYKSIDEIMEYLEETVEVIDVIKPVYNFKA